MWEGVGGSGSGSESGREWERVGGSGRKWGRVWEDVGEGVGRCGPEFGGECGEKDEVIESGGCGERVRRKRCTDG